MNGRLVGIFDRERVCARLGVTLPLIGLLSLNQCGGGEPTRVSVGAGPGSGSGANGSLLGNGGFGGGGGSSSASAGNRTAQGATSSMASGDAPGTPGSDPPSSGSLGSGPGALARAGEACSVPGENACVGASQKQRLVCSDGTWEPGTACSATQNCDQLSGDCLPIPPECVGQSVGFRFCGPLGTIGVCGLDLVRVESEDCEGTCASGRCTPLGCGDGVVTPPEECDDGNDSDTDDCTSECKSAGCGDGTLQAGEECDDGNAVNTDSCVDCKMGRCGDTFVQAGEACDDGNSVDADACTNECQLPGCGDNILQTGEECDDGNTLDNDTCTNGCTRPKCGDRIIQMGEACDDGNTINDDACSNMCTVPGCPDDIKQMSEECDDGNMNSTDGCTAACKLPKCGDSFTQDGEECDDGNTANDDGCTGMCKRPKCGDNITQRPTEECDDGNTNDLDACSNSCKPKRCGDNITQDGEACDDGNQNNTDACRNDCQKATCGDSLKSDGEGCDDGNTQNGDGCSSSCQNELRCGDGTTNGTEECDDGNTNDSEDACTNQCKQLKPLNELNPSCSESNITFTLCITAATNWCKAFGNNPGVIVGKPNNDQDRYNVACLDNVQRQSITVPDTFGKSGGACPGGQQQFPACLNAVTELCQEKGFTYGFYTGLNDNTQLQAACGHARAATVKAGAIGGGCTISATSSIPLACTAAIAKRCRDAGDGKTGMIVGVDGEDVDYVCLSGVMGIAEYDR